MINREKGKGNNLIDEMRKSTWESPTKVTLWLRLLTNLIMRYAKSLIYYDQ